MGKPGVIDYVYVRVRLSAPGPIFFDTVLEKYCRSKFSFVQKKIALLLYNQYSSYILK